MKENESNSAKSKHGSSLNKQLKILMLNLLSTNKIASFKDEPRYNYPGKKRKQFSPDGEITLLDGNIIIYDNTTTIRHDRLKQKLWDAYGVKKYFQEQNLNIKYYVIIPNKISPKEVKNFSREQKKINDPEYYSSIDSIITIDELLNLIVS